MKFVPFYPRPPTIADASHGFGRSKLAFKKCSPGNGAIPSTLRPCTFGRRPTLKIYTLELHFKDKKPAERPIKAGP